MIRVSRLNFSQYLTVSAAVIPKIIDDAAGGTVDRDSIAYNRSYTRILEWRKNWFSNFMRNVDLYREKLEKENVGYATLGEEFLKQAYSKHFSFEGIFFIMGTMSAVIDWRATIVQPAVKALYKTIFTYSLM